MSCFTILFSSKVFEIQVYFRLTNSTSPFGAATFHVLKSHMWLSAAILHSAVLYFMYFCLVLNFL